MRLSFNPIVISVKICHVRFLSVFLTILEKESVHNYCNLLSHLRELF